MPTITNQVRMLPARSRSTVPLSAAAKVRKECLPTWIATYEPANSSACAPKACGIATDIRRLTSINDNSSRRTGTVSVSSSLVVQVV